jgi:hypothetical protein
MPAFQILDLCPSCRVESALAAVFDPLDPCCLLGVCSTSRCRLCGRETRGRVTPAIEPPPDAEERLRSEQCPACAERLGDTEIAESRCEQCGAVADEREVRAGESFESEVELRLALRRWGGQEGHETANEFAEACFLDERVGRIYERIRDREVVETNFDVLAFLFPEMAMAAAIPDDALDEGAPAPPRPRPERTPPPPSAPSRPRPQPEDPTDETPTIIEPAAPAADPDPAAAFRGEPWAPLLPLVSVMVADGRVHPAEHAFLKRFLKANRCPPIPTEHLRVHRPDAVPLPPDPRTRARMLEAMVHLVHVDRLRDGSEFRVVEEFARAWGVDPMAIARWDALYRKRHATGLQRLWLILQSTFFKR